MSKSRTDDPLRRQRLRRTLAQASLLLALVASAYYLTSPPRAQVASGNIVISQVYGGGGNSGATYQNDFIELFNRGNTAINVSGFSGLQRSTSGHSPSGSNVSNNDETLRLR